MWKSVCGKSDASLCLEENIWPEAFFNGSGECNHPDDCFQKAF